MPSGPCQPWSWSSYDVDLFQAELCHRVAACRPSGGPRQCSIIGKSSVSRHGGCPLWVTSGHLQCKRPCRLNYQLRVEADTTPSGTLMRLDAAEASASASSIRPALRCGARPLMSRWLCNGLELSDLARSNSLYAVAGLGRAVVCAWCGLALRLCLGPPQRRSRRGKIPEAQPAPRRGSISFETKE